MSIKDALRRRKRVDSLVEEHLEKGAMTDAGKAFLYTMGGGLASAGVAYGVPAALESIQGLRIRNYKDKFLAKMKAAHPEIKNFSRRDIDLVYNSLSLHAPKVLKDPLVGGQVMLQALQRGNNMDIGMLGNVSKMTGGSGVSEHQRDAANMLARQIGQGAMDYGKARYDSKVEDARAIEKIKAHEARKTETYKMFIKEPSGGGKGPARSYDVAEASGYKKRYQAYKKAKST